MIIREVLIKAIGHHNNGELQEAGRLYTQILQRDPNHPDANHNLGALAVAAGKIKEAIVFFEKAVALYPHIEQFHQSLNYAKEKLNEKQAEEINESNQEQCKTPSQDELNIILNQYNKGNFSKALELVEHFTKLYSDNPFVYNLQGAILKGLQRSEEAVKFYKKAISLKPNYPQAYSNLGVVLVDLGKVEEAVKFYKKAISLNPNYPQAYSNLGNALRELGKSEEAIRYYEKAISLKADFVEAYVSLGAVMYDLGMLEETIELCRKAIALNPNFAEAYSNLGNALGGMCKLDEAIKSFRKTIELNHNLEDTFGNLLFILNYHPDKSAEEIFETYREYNEKFTLPLLSLQKPHLNNKNPDRKLKIGYVSPDFKNHSVGRFLEPLLANHDKSRFEIFLYAETVREDEATQRYKAYADTWVKTVGLSDIELAERIMKDEIDILVELAGHSANNRLLVFAQKPTPISLSWLGYGYTTGVSAIDYYLTDDINVPKGSENLFSEKPWRIENPSFVFRPSDGMGVCGELPALNNGHITFGTLTRSIRINYKIIRTWSNVLNSVSNSKLKIDSKNYLDKRMREELIKAFMEYGVDESRLGIGYSSPPWDTLRSIDICLDCFPHNSGTTLVESLYMGVPYVTLADRPSVGRIGSSILQGIGRGEWVARNEEEYVEKLVKLSEDIKKLSTIRKSLREEMLKSPLMDEAGFARKIEKAYSEMFAEWIGG